jgi:hypothetical protein
MGHGTLASESALGDSAYLSVKQGTEQVLPIWGWGVSEKTTESLLGPGDKVNKGRLLTLGIFLPSL